MEIDKNEHQEIDNFNTSNENNNKFYLFNLLAKKTTDDLVKIISLGLSIPLLIALIGNYNLVLSLIKDLIDTNFNFTENRYTFIYSLIFICYLMLVATFYKKKRIGWIGLNFIFISVFGTYLVEFIFVITRLLITFLINNFSLFETFNYKNLYVTFCYIIFFGGLIYVVNNKNILMVFNIGKYLKLFTYVIAILVVISWSYRVFPNSFQEIKGERENLPKEYQNRFDIKNNNPNTINVLTKNNNVRELFDQGKKLRLSSDFLGAIRYYKEALKIEPNNIYILWQLADSYAHNNDIRIGIKFLDKAIAIDSENFGLYNDRGVFYYKLCENDMALMNFNKALKIDSTNPTVYVNLALVYHYMKLQDKSIQSFVKAKRYGANSYVLNDTGKIIGYTSNKIQIYRP